YGFFFSSRRRHTRSDRDWSSDVCSSDLVDGPAGGELAELQRAVHRLADGLAAESRARAEAFDTLSLRIDRLAAALEKPSARIGQDRKSVVVGKAWRSRWEARRVRKKE